MLVHCSELLWHAANSCGMLQKIFAGQTAGAATLMPAYASKVEADGDQAPWSKLEATVLHSTDL